MNRKFFTIVTVIIFLSAKSFADVSPEKGKTIFTTRCNSCHNVNAQLVGPALANVEERRSTDWIISFVHSPKAMIAKNDTAAIALYTKFNNITMPDHQDLSADDIKNVLAYIKSETKTPAADVTTFAKPGMMMPNYHPVSITKDAWFFITFLLVVFVLIGLLVFAVNIKTIQRNSYSQAEDE